MLVNVEPAPRMYAMPRVAYHEYPAYYIFNSNKFRDAKLELWRGRGGEFEVKRG